MSMSSSRGESEWPARAVVRAASVAFAVVSISLHVSARAADDDNTLEEVTVTARYRAESLQDTPISITALTYADLEARGMTDVTDLTATVPSTSLVREGSTGGATLVAYVRGLGQANYSLAFQPGVPIYVDDVYQPTAFGSLLTLGDVERIDVLRGPQGTLFGKNSEGGAVAIHLTDPRGDGSGYVQVGAGSYDERRVRAAFDFALVPDKLFMRVAGGTQKSNGYVDRIDYVCANPADAGALKPTAVSNCKIGEQGGLDETFGRVALKWVVNDDVAARLSLSTIDSTDQAVPEVPLIIDPASPGSNLAAFNTRVALPLYGIPISAKFIAPDPYTNYATFANPANGLTFSPYSPEKLWDATAKLDWANLPGGMRFASITGYHHLRGTIPEYKDGPIPINMISNTITYESYSEEDRLSGTAFDSKFEWTAGLYYFHGKGSQIGDINLSLSQVGPFFGINETLVSFTTDSNRSVYLHSVYHFTDKLSLETGARYSRDRFTFSYDGTNHAQVPVNTLKPPGSKVFGPVPIPVASTDSRVDPKVALQYEWTPRFMTYASYGTGYKGGGTNPSPITAAQATPFSVESLKAYELGAKSQFFDRRLAIDLTAYRNDVQDLQLIGFAPTTIGGTVTLNAGHAIVTGGELEVQARPTPALLFNLSGGYMNFHYRSLGAAAFSPQNPGGLLLTDVAPFSPKWKGNVGAQYTQRLGDAGALTPRLDYTYQSRVFFDPHNILPSSQAGYGLLNAHLTWTNSGGEWAAALDVNNLTDKLYYLSKFNQLASFGILTGQPGEPRTFIVSVKRTFQ